MAIDSKATSSYLDLLPSIYAEHPHLGRFLLAFEQILTGLTGAEDEPAQGLEQAIAGIAAYLDPQATPKEFLPWLAGWVALGLRADWTEQQQRDFLSGIVPLYRRRGTKENLANLLRIYTGLAPVIAGVEDTDFQIRVHSTIGKDTALRGSQPHHFHVQVTMGNPGVDELQRAYDTAHALIELQKPAHTTFDLTIVFGTMQIGARSTIGVDTLLGSVPVQ